MLSSPLGKYTFNNSFLHKLDARFKIFALILLMVAVFLPLRNMYMDFTFYGFMLLFVLFLMKLSHIHFMSLIKMLKPMTFMIVFILIINLFVVREGNPIYIFNLTIYDTALYNTLYTLLRLVLMVSLSLILISTTKPMDLTYALEWYLYPLKFIKVPIHIIAMIISLALRFIPTLLEETEKIMKAQASRGVDFVNGKLKEKIKAIISLIVPLFISSLQRSVELADAMEVRGYDPNGKRTRYRIMRFSSKDLISLIFITVLFTINILLVVYHVDFYKGILK